MAILSKAQYGKDNVRILRVVRDGKFHTVVEYVVKVLLEGNIETSYTQADNTVVVATDSMKNIINVSAKTSPFVLQPELFALDIATLVLKKYKHICTVNIDVTQHKWTRIVGSSSSAASSTTEKEPHPHAFIQDGQDKRVVSGIVSRRSDDCDYFTVTEFTAGIKDVLVLKSTGSAFENFVRDEYTTLPEVNDRIFSTSIDCLYTLKLDTADPELLKGSIPFDKIFSSCRTILLDTFANDESASVQATLYKMATLILQENPIDVVTNVKITLPNKHYIPIDLSFANLSNLNPSDAEVFLPSLAPNGLITATLSRD